MRSKARQQSRQTQANKTDFPFYGCITAWTTALPTHRHHNYTSNISKPWNNNNVNLVYTVRLYGSKTVSKHRRMLWLIKVISNTTIDHRHLYHSVHSILQPCWEFHRWQYQGATSAWNINNTNVRATNKLWHTTMCVSPINITTMQ